MKTGVFAVALAIGPPMAAGAGDAAQGAVSEADTAFVQHCLADVTPSRVAQSKKKTAEMPPVPGTITKNCGGRSSVMPVLWLGR